MFLTNSVTLKKHIVTVATVVCRRKWTKTPQPPATSNINQRDLKSWLDAPLITTSPSPIAGVSHFTTNSICRVSVETIATNCSPIIHEQAKNSSTNRIAIRIYHTKFWKFNYVRNWYICNTTAVIRLLKDCGRVKNCTENWKEVVILDLPGQSFSLQGLLSDASPTQSAPPWAGAGWVQVLVLVWIPPLQRAEHSDHSPKSLYPPSTENNNDHTYNN